MMISNNLIRTKDNNYLPYLEVIIKDDYTFIIKIKEDIETHKLYNIIYSYIKNKDLILKSVVALKPRVLGVEYINLINMVDLSYFEFTAMKKKFLSENAQYQDSNILFDSDISDLAPLQIEITTFNKNKITTNTKPRVVEGIIQIVGYDTIN